jgi:hypothetical protein
MYAIFRAQSGNRELRRGVGGSVPTDLCHPASSKGNTVMQKLLGLLAVLVLVTVAPGSARAQDKKGGDKGGTPKVKVYDFSGDTIEGDLIRPEGTTVDTRGFANHASLIKIRKDFIPEIIKSAEDL